jgi:hypothetical protein
MTSVVDGFVLIAARREHGTANDRNSGDKQYNQYFSEIFHIRLRINNLA